MQIMQLKMALRPIHLQTLQHMEPFMEAQQVVQLQRQHLLFVLSTRTWQTTVLFMMPQKSM